MFPVLGISSSSSLFKRSFVSIARNEPKFPRTKEEALLRKLMQEQARIIFLTGPIFVGKRTLALNVLKKISVEDNRPFIQFDSILKNTQGFALSSFNMQHTSISKWNEWLRGLSNISSKEKTRPIIYFDEPAQLFSPQDLTTQSFCEWIADNSKRNHSDFILRFEQGDFCSKIRSFFKFSEVTTFEVEHLSKDEAFVYWSELINKVGRQWPEVASPLFEAAYSVCEGSLHFLKRYCLDYYHSKGCLKPDQFVPVSEERKKLVHLFFGGKDKKEIEKRSFYSGSPPDLTEMVFEKKWTREQFSIFLKMIISSKPLTFEKACLTPQLGINFINRMIEEKVVVLSYINSKSTLNPYVPPTRFAIESLLKDLNTGKLKE